MSDEQFLTSPFLPRFHLFSHKLYFLRAPRAPLGPPGPGALAPATPPPLSGPAHIEQYEVGTLAIDGWLLHLVQRGGDLAGSQPAQAPHRCIKCNSLPINGLCTNHSIAV